MSTDQSQNGQVGELSQRYREIRRARPAARVTSRGVLWIAIGAAAVVMCVCAGMVVLALGVGRGVVWLIQEGGNAQKTVDAYMRAMRDKDPEAAYELFSTRAKRTTSLARLQELVEGGSYVLVEGYESAEVSSINITMGVNRDPRGPQGRVAEVSGTLRYAGGHQGEFEAVLEQEGGRWWLYGINVMVSPEKLDDRPQE